MRSGQRDRLVTELEQLVACLKTDSGRGIERLHEFMAGYPTGGTTSPSPMREDDDDEGSAIDYSDRTGELALRPDEARQAVQRFDTHLESSVAGLRNAVRIVQAALIAGRSVTSGPDCKSCARDVDHRGRPYRVPAHREKLALCQFCSRWLSEHGAWPPVKILVVHHRGVVVTPTLAERVMRTT